MKRLPSDQTKILFSFLKRFYPCKTNPKIVVLLLNEKEWEQIWLAGRDGIKNRKPTKELVEELEKTIQHFREKPEEIDDLPEKQQYLVRNMLEPHFAPEAVFDLKEYMNEIMGDHYSIKNVQKWAKVKTMEIPEIIQTHMNYDHVILISYFMNKEQWKTLHHDNKLFRMMITQTIFHEMIHVIEDETKTKIFKTATREEDMAIITPIFDSFLKQYSTFFEIILEV